MNQKITFLTVFIFATLFNVTQLVAQWTAQTSPTTGKLEGLWFTSPTVGFAAGGFTNMYKTINGGQTWTSVGSYNARDIWFVDATIGYASSVTGTAMKKTVNGGTTWTPITPPNSSSYYGVSATSATNAYFINTEDKVIKTINGGTTVSSYTIPLPMPGGDDLTDIFFTNATTGYIGTNASSIGLYKTTNSGSTWVPLSLGVSIWVRSIWFVNPMVGYAGGSAGKVIKTTDGGNTWVERSITGTSAINALKFYDENNGIAVCLSGKIFKTNNGGVTWFQQDSGTTQHLWNVFYLDANSAVAIGDNGTILKNLNVLATPEYSKPEATFSLSPNPLTDASVLSVSDRQGYDKLDVEIYSVKGLRVLQAEMPLNQYLLNKRDFSAGVYFLQVKSRGGLVETIKFVVE